MTQRKKKRTPTRLTFSKKWVNRLMWVALIDIQLPFVLAFFGREQIAETLAIAIVGEILGIIIPYFTKSYFETKEEEKNKLIYDKRLREDGFEPIFLDNENEEDMR